MAVAPTPRSTSVNAAKSSGLSGSCSRKLLAVGGGEVEDGALAP
jgi:hypothetical protein